MIENERCKILWDMNIQYDHVIETRRPDIVVVVDKKNNKVIIVDIASLWDVTECMKRRVKRLKSTKI